MAMRKRLYLNSRAEPYALRDDEDLEQLIRVLRDAVTAPPGGQSVIAVPVVVPDGDDQGQIDLLIIRPAAVESFLVTEVPDPKLGRPSRVW
jgi:hypothetical protein